MQGGSRYINGRVCVLLLVLACKFCGIAQKVHEDPLDVLCIRLHDAVLLTWHEDQLNTLWNTTHALQQRQYTRADIDDADIDRD